MTLQMKLKSLLLASICLLLTVPSVWAQEASESASGDPSGKRFNKWRASLHFGHLVPYTDTRQYDYFPVTKHKNENRVGVGLNLEYNISNVFSLRGHGMFGSLQGTNRTLNGSKDNWFKDTQTDNIAPGQVRGRYFKTNVTTGSINMIMNVSNVAFKPKGPGEQRKLGIYMFAGLGLVRFNAKTFDLNGGNEIGVYKQGFSGKTTEGVVPVGLGLKYYLNNKMDISLESVMNRVNSDKLDGWEAGSSPDYYGYTNLALSYKFGGAGADGEHLEWVNPLSTMYQDIQDNRQKIAALTSDKDADGVADYFDKDSNTPEGTTVSGSGIGIDVDKDGIPDSEDEDPFTDIGAKVDEKGKAVDSDGDGVPDNRDLEANTTKGALVNYQGKTIGALPTAGSGGGGGISSGGGGGTAVLPSVYFDLNSSTVKYANYDRVATIARAMKMNPDISIVLTGNTDVSGSENYNKTLGQRRSNAVADHLVKHYGIDKGRIDVQSDGEEKPLAKGLNHINRRVDVSVK